jgi:argininosuccinate lyase
MLVNADRLSEDLQIWATAEFGLIELADRHSRISVIMPQKKNPYSLAFVRGVAREMIGRLTSAAASVTPSGQIDNRIFAYGGVPQALEQSRQAVQLLAGTVAGLSVNRAVMAQRAGQSYSSATDLAELMLQEAGVDANMAHRIVGQAVRMALPTGQVLDSGLLDQAAQNVIGRLLNLSQERVAMASTRRRLSRRAPAQVEPLLKPCKLC